MTQHVRMSMPRWALALLAGSISAALLIALFRFGLGLDLALSAFLGGAFGLCIAFLVARWFTAAGVVMGILEIAVSALAAAVAIVAAVLGALS